MEADRRVEDVVVASVCARDLVWDGLGNNGRVFDDE